MGTAFLSKLKVAINEEFSRGMSKISKGEGCKKGGSNTMGIDLFAHCKTCLRLPKGKPSHKCTVLNRLD